MHTQKGLSLLELIIVISICGILFSAMLFDYSRCTQRRQLEITGRKVEADLHWTRTKAIASDCDGAVIFNPNGYQCEQVRIDGSRAILKRRDYPLAITGSTGRLGYKNSGTTMYAGSIYLQSINGDQYKISVTPVTGKVTLRKL